MVEFALGMLVRLRICRLIGMKKRRKKKREVSSYIEVNSAGVGEIAKKKKPRAPASVGCDWLVQHCGHVIYLHEH